MPEASLRSSEPKRWYSCLSFFYHPLYQTDIDMNLRAGCNAGSMSCAPRVFFFGSKQAVAVAVAVAVVLVRRRRDVRLFAKFGRWLLINTQQLLRWRLRRRPKQAAATVLRLGHRRRRSWRLFAESKEAAATKSNRPPSPVRLTIAKEAAAANSRVAKVGRQSDARNHPRRATAIPPTHHLRVQSATHHATATMTNRVRRMRRDESVGGTSFCVLPF